MNEKVKVFVIGNDKKPSDDIVDILTRSGYNVKIMHNFDGLNASIQKFDTDIIIIDSSEDDVKSNEIFEELLKDDTIRNISKVLISPNIKTLNAIMKVNSIFIDGYLLRILNIELLLPLRMKVFEKWKNIINSFDPITGLGKKNIIKKNIAKLIENKNEFAFAYYQINGLEGYIEKYSYVKVIDILNDLIRFTKDGLNVINSKDIPFFYMGHLGADAIILIAPFDIINDLSKKVIKTFDTERLEKYHTQNEIDKGFILINKNGTLEKDKILSLEILITSTEKRMFSSLNDILKVIGELKKIDNKFIDSVIINDKREDKSGKFSIIKSTTERRTLIKSPQILTTDSDVHARNLYKKYLEIQNMHVVYAEDLTSALASVYENSIDIILLDLDNNTNEVFNFITLLKKSSTNISKIPIIIFSNSSDKDFIIKSIKMGATSFIAKPINQQFLYKNIYNILVSN